MGIEDLETVMGKVMGNICAKSVGALVLYGTSLGM